MASIDEVEFHIHQSHGHCDVCISHGIDSATDRILKVISGDRLAELFELSSIKNPQQLGEMMARELKEEIQELQFEGFG